MLQFSENAAAAIRVACLFLRGNCLARRVTLPAQQTPIVSQAVRKFAAFLSIIWPGLEQLYKGHHEEGLLWMCFGMPIAIWVGILLALATAGVGLIIPLLCWAALAVEASYEKDLRVHHWLPPRDCQT